MPDENRFHEWLRDALAGRPNVFLVRGSGLKENGRPVIDDSRVSKWLKGEQRPSMELAALSARVLGASQADALKAAGYAYGHSLESIERIEREYPATAAHMRMVPSDEFDRLLDLHKQMGDLLEDIASGQAGQRQATRHRNALEARRALEHIEGGDGDVDSTEPGDSAPNRPAGSELSAAPDELPAAAKRGVIEESGEFNT